MQGSSLLCGTELKDEKETQYCFHNSVLILLAVLVVLHLHCICSSCRLFFYILGQLLNIISCVSFSMLHNNLIVCISQEYVPLFSLCIVMYSGSCALYSHSGNFDNVMLCKHHICIEKKRKSEQEDTFQLIFYIHCAYGRN